MNLSDLPEDVIIYEIFEYVILNKFTICRYFHNYIIYDSIEFIPYTPNILNLYIYGNNTISVIPNIIGLKKLYIDGNNTISVIPNIIGLQELRIY